MLARLRITERLGLVLLLPFIAIVLTSVPFTVDRVNDARAASLMTHRAGNARVAGVLIQELEQERLLILAYGASTRVDRTALISAIADVRDLVAQTRQQFRGSAPLLAALAGLNSLEQVRRAALNRAAAASDVNRSYDDAVTALIDGLQLADSAAMGGNRQRELMSLDSLLRANAQAARVGAAVVMAARDPVAAGQFAGSAAILARSHIEQFRRQADPVSVAAVEVGVDGSSARLVNQLAATLTQIGPNSIPVDVGLSAAGAAVAVLGDTQDDVAGRLAAQARRQADTAVGTAVVVTGFSTLLIVVVLCLGSAVSRSIAQPLRRVTSAATTVADIASRELSRLSDIESDDNQPPRLAAVSIRSNDEIGELASAFNRVQATAALMLEQQTATRRNVSTMFANIAHRTGGLVARQLAQIDELERGEVDEDRLAKLYRLDHLTTRLRRSAESLLVIAGSRSETLADVPISLADVIRSAVAEVEGYQTVALGRVTSALVTASAAPDLTLLLAELIENATAFSPPGQTVEISATVRTEGVVHIVDRGIGMTDDRLAQENEQFVARERLDIAPTTTLGLLVVGRIARRHGITVRLRPTFGSGVTAEVVLPQELFVAGVRRPESGDVAGRGDLESDPGPGRAIIGVASVGRADPGRPVTARAIVGDPGLAARPTLTGGAGLRRRQPGVALGEAIALGASTTAGGPRHAAPMRDPESERTERRALTHGIASAPAGQPDNGQPILGRPPVTPSTDAPTVRSAPAQGTPVQSRAGLQRRRPGEHLDPSLRDEIPGYRQVLPLGQGAAAPPSQVARNAEAERTAFSDYLYGLSRASKSIDVDGRDYPNSLNPHESHHRDDPRSQR